ncbi:prepilin peptidase [Phenylobacterium sp.]|uniref:A24 family peptidase n=1 Tax=Phenylobacterium sp. TaxID=1871053 RepID=UPI00286D12AD|nr:prepilin peptidase [Phenylobacterium sp.]
MHALQSLVLLAFPLLTLIAALRDATSYTIPNWISLALVGIFPLAALALGLPLAVLGGQLGLGAAALVAAMAMFALGWIGGGDAKLFAAAALWLGWPAILTFLAVTGVAGGVLAVGLLALRAPAVRRHLPAGPGWFVRLAEPGENVPYGVAIAVGALAAFPGCSLLARL